MAKDNIFIIYNLYIIKGERLVMLKLILKLARHFP